MHLQASKLLDCYLMLILVATSLCGEDVTPRDEISKENATLISLIENSNNNQESQIKRHDGNLWEMVASMGPSSGQQDGSERADFDPSGDYDFGLTLDQANRFKLYWSYDYPNNLISFSLHLNISNNQLNQHRAYRNHKLGSDIFALGFSERGLLERSDFCLIWYDLAQKIHLQDAKLDEHIQLELIDESSSFCRLKSVSEIGEGSETVARIEFTRPLDTCTADNVYYQIDNGTTHLVWFSIKGPVLSLNGLNVGALEESSQKARNLEAKLMTNLAANNHSNVNNHTNSPIISGRFEWSMKRVQLIANKKAKLTNARHLTTQSRYHYHDIHMEAYPIPARETTYQCRLFKLPDTFQRRKHHIVKFGPLITRGNGHIVHHMELFNCVNLSPSDLQEMQQLYSSGGGWSGECESARRPPITRTCKKVILAWAMGAKTFEYPAQVGQLIGGHADADERQLHSGEFSPFVMLEVHYNNVEQLAGLMDFSGLRFYYTSKLRQFDAGILEVGLEYTPKNSIPPLGSELVPISGHCASECTRIALAPDSGQSRHNANSKLLSLSTSKSIANQADARARNINGNLTSIRDLNENDDDEPDEPDLLSSGGIFIFGAQMHTHLSGVSSWTEQLRGNELIGELQRDDHYSPHFQEIRLLPRRKYLAPGDSLRHYCLYNTAPNSASGKITLGGFSTQEEMCVTYLHYYPRKQLEVCKSSVDSSALSDYFAYLAREESQQTSDSNAETSPGLGVENVDHAGNHNHNHYDSNENNGAKQRANHKTNNEENLDGQVANAKTLAKSVGENYNSIEWSRRRSLELLQFYSLAPLSIQCNRSDGTRFAGFWDKIPQTIPTHVTIDEEHDSWAQINLRTYGNLRAPFEAPRAASGAQLATYRGANYQRRHAQCANKLRNHRANNRLNRMLMKPVKFLSSNHKQHQQRRQHRSSDQKYHFS